MTEAERPDALVNLGLSPMLMALAVGRWPHPMFEFSCSTVYKCYHVPSECWPAEFVPLWECGETTIGCRRAAGGLEFVAWHLESHDPPERLARTEQGLFFWLFSYLTESEAADDEIAALERLKTAADAVGFRHFDRLWAFVLEHGQQLNYSEHLQAAAWDIPA